MRDLMNETSRHGAAERQATTPTSLEAVTAAIEKPWRDLARDMIWHLDVEHRVRRMHDSLGANLGCSGCDLLERLEAATEGASDDQPSEGLLTR